MSSRLAKNTAHLTLATIGQKVIAFVYFLFVARIMMPEQTGIYFLSISIAMIFSVVSDFGMTPVVIREIAKNPHQTQSILRRALAAKIPLLVIGYFLSVGSAYFLGYQAQIIRLVSLTGLVFFLDSISLLFYGVLRGHQRLSIESMGLFIGQSVMAILGGMILFIHPSLLLLVIALFFGSLTNVFVSAVYVSKQFGTIVFLPLWEKQQIVRLFGMALPFALAAIFVKVYSYVDTLFISKFLDARAVGLYSLAYKFTYAFQFLPLAFIAALYPGLSSVIDSDQVELAHMFKRAIWYVLILAVPIVFGIWLVADHAVLLAGKGYRDSAPVLSVLIFVLIPIFLDFPIGALLNAAGWQAKKMYIMGGTMILSIIFNALFIPHMGIIGAAYAALISFTTMFLAGLFFVPRLIPTFRYRDFIFQCIPILLSGLVMVIVGQILLHFLNWLIVVPLCMCVYGIGLILTRSIQKDDVRSFLSALKKSV